MEILALVIIGVVFWVLGYNAHIIEGLITAVALLVALCLWHDLDGFIVIAGFVIFGALFGADRWKLHREISYHRAQDLRNEILHDMENGE